MSIASSIGRLHDAAENSIFHHHSSLLQTDFGRNRTWLWVERTAEWRTGDVVIDEIGADAAETACECVRVCMCECGAVSVCVSLLRQQLFPYRDGRQNFMRALVTVGYNLNDS